MNYLFDNIIRLEWNSAQYRSSLHKKPVFYFLLCLCDKLSMFKGTRAKGDQSYARDENSFYVIVHTSGLPISYPYNLV